MFEIDPIIDFTAPSAETLYLDAAKIQKNFSMLSLDLSKVSDVKSEDFVKLYIGISGGHIRPVLASTKMLREFIDSHITIADTISKNASNYLTGEADE